MMDSGFSIKLGDLQTANITDFRAITARTAQVIVSTSIKNSSSLSAKLYDLMKGKATPITASFRWLDKPNNSVAIGYVARLDESRTVEDKTINASYQLIASNQYLDKSDESLWELRSTPGGKKVMVRHSDDDLSELLHKVQAKSVPNVPRLSSIQASAAQAHRLAAFVHEPETGLPSLQYGFVIGSKESNPIIINASTSKVGTVNRDLVVGYYSVDDAEIKAAHARAVAEGGTQVTAGFNAQPVIDYYRKVIPYSSEYMTKLVKVIKETAAL